MVPAPRLEGERAKELSPLWGDESSMGLDHGGRHCVRAGIWRRWSHCWRGQHSTKRRGSSFLSPSHQASIVEFHWSNLARSQPARGLGHHGFQGSAPYCTGKSRRIGNNMKANHQMTHPWGLVLVGSSLKFFSYSEDRNIFFHVIFYSLYNFDFYI